jgi:xanthine dehydrogenase accessory factor
MKDREHILQRWSEAERQGESAVLATVVKTSGSSYRLPGARLLITRRERAGSISGGCLEDDLVKKAWWLTESGPVIRRYDTTPDGELATDFGLGCNGVIHVLLERVTPGQATDLDLLKRVQTERRSGSLAQIIGPRTLVGGKLIVDTDGSVRQTFPSPELGEELRRAVEGSAPERGSETLLLCSDTEVFVETLSPATRLLIFGAGDDAVPLSTLGKFLGWEVIVIDGRSHYARREKFPQADEVLVCDAGNASWLDRVDAWTVAVIMTHSYAQDLEILRELSSRPLRYLGLLGPRKRSQQLLSDAQADCLRSGTTLFNPVGLDIGADGPTQVALAITAEIQAVLNGRHGSSLRDRPGSIHSDRPTSRDEEPFVIPSGACAF